MPTRRLTALEARIGYQFSDQALALRALTHSSYGEGRRAMPDNEQLEFLGDRVLGLLTADWLYTHMGESEGQMARRLNALVRKETCARVAQTIGLGEALRLSPAEVKQGGREKISILGDACESLLAALYLDGGIRAAKAFYDQFWAPEIDVMVAALDGGQTMKDPKTELQERALALGPETPEYKLVERSGPDHRPNFIVTVSVKKIGTATGEGTSKKAAERDAATQLLGQWDTA